MIQPSKHPKLNPLGIPYFLTKHSGGFRRKLEKTRGVKFFSTGSHVKKWKKKFLFSMMWLYPVLFSINSRLQKCNLFACTPRMNNSRLSKHTTVTFFNINANFEDSKMALRKYHYITLEIAVPQTLLNT